MTGLNIGKMWPKAAFSQKAQIVAFLHDESRNNQPRFLSLRIERCASKHANVQDFHAKS